MFILESAGQYENLFTTKVFMGLKPFSGRPFHQRDMFMLKLMQWHDFKSTYAGKPLGVFGVDIKLLFILLIKLIELYK